MTKLKFTLATFPRPIMALLNIMGTPPIAGDESLGDKSVYAI